VKRMQAREGYKRAAERIIKEVGSYEPGIWWAREGEIKKPTGLLNTQREHKCLLNCKLATAVMIWMKFPLVQTCNNSIRTTPKTTRSISFWKIANAVRRDPEFFPRATLMGLLARHRQRRASVGLLALTPTSTFSEPRPIPKKYSVCPHHVPFVLNKAGWWSSMLNKAIQRFLKDNLHFLKGRQVREERHIEPRWSENQLLPYWNQNWDLVNVW
jgi:hypothetical protein